MRQQIALFILYYLRFFAKLQLLKNKDCKVIGITGSAGKSSTRNAIYTVLSSKYIVKASFKANSESGISLDILGLEMRNYSPLDWLRVLFMAPIKLLTNFSKFDYYVVEMGIDSPDSPKNMDFLLSIIRPEMAVFLGANLNHSFAFDHLVSGSDPQQRKQAIIHEIAKEKAKLILSLPQTGIAFLNFDDSNVKSTSQNTKAKIYSFGSDGDDTLQIMSHRVSLQNGQINTEFGFLAAGQKFHIKINNFLLAKHYSYSLAAAIAVGLTAQLSVDEIKNALENQLNLPLGRASIIAGKNDSLIIDSSYNASSMKDMLELAATVPNQGRKLALLGDMRELGEETAVMHQEIATLASQNFDQIFLVGQEMSKYALPIIKNKAKNVQAFNNSIEAGQTISKLLKPGDLILVKGSQNTIFLEEAIKEMMETRSEAAEQLCRQSLWWLSVKRQALTK